jgi:hypothetical protein
MGIGVDGLLSSRAYAIADIEDIGTGMEKFTRTFARHTGMNAWNSFQKKIAAFTAQNRFIDDARKYSKLSSNRKARLAQAGINERMAKSIAKQSDEFGEKLGGSWHANTADWTDREAANLFERVLLKDVDNTIITPSIGDKPLLMSTEMGKTLLQFKTFFLAAHNQAFLPLAHQLSKGDMAAVQGIMFGFALGMMSEMTRLKLSGREDEFEDYTMADWARAGLDRSGMATVPMELINMSDRLLEGRLSATLGMKEGSRMYYRNFFGTLLGPTASYVDDSINLAQSLVKGDGVSERDIHGIRRLMPYQNMFYLRMLMNDMEDSVSGALDATPSERRRGGNTKTINVN